MTTKSAWAVFLILALGVGIAAAGVGASKAKDNATTTAVPGSHAAQDDAVRLEGEKRFHSNCGRCHAAPPKFSPRMTATIIRHMRVRALITDEDLRLILRYMTQ